MASKRKTNRTKKVKSLSTKALTGSHARGVKGGVGSEKPPMQFLRIKQ